MGLWLQGSIRIFETLNFAGSGLEFVLQTRDCFAHSISFSFFILLKWAKLILLSLSELILLCFNLKYPVLQISTLWVKMITLLIMFLLHLYYISLKVFKLVLSSLFLSCNLVKLFLNDPLLAENCLLILLNFCSMLFELSRLELFLLNLGMQYFDLIFWHLHLVGELLDLRLLLLDELVLFNFLLIKFLFEASHQCIHHEIAILFHVQWSFELLVFLLKLAEQLRAFF